MAEIETLCDKPDFKMFSTTCTCTGHGMQVVVERDENVIYLSFETRVGWWEHSYSGPKLFWERLKRATKLLFLGECEHNESFIFRDEDQINGLLGAIIAVKNEMLPTVIPDEITKRYYGITTIGENVKKIKEYMAKEHRAPVTGELEVEEKVLSNLSISKNLED